MTAVDERTIAPTAPPDGADRRRRAIAAGVVGNALEWYDFGVYGFLATAIAKQFFPTSDAYVGLLQTFGAFAAGYLARPIGSVLLGRLADRIGRRAALTATIAMMAIGTIAIGLVPSYATIGVAAPAILLLARVVQGLAAGGEWGTAAAFLAEWAGPNRRGLYGGMLLASVSAGLLLGSGVAALLSSSLAPDAFASWGWRIPFLLGVVLVPMGIYLRRHVDEPPVFEAHAAAVAAVRPPIAGVFVRAVMICLPLLIGSYMATVYLPSFGQLQGHVGRSAALWSNTAALALSVVAAPLWGLLSDRIGRRRQLLLACVALVLLPYPLFAAIADGTTFAGYLGLQLALTLAVVAFTGPAPACIAELFPTTSRAAGASTANAIAGIVGGSSPFISTWLIAATGIPASPSWLIVASAVAAAAALVGLREMAHEPLS